MNEFIEYDYDNLEEAMKDGFLYYYNPNCCLDPISITVGDNYYGVKDMQEYWKKKRWT